MILEVCITLAVCVAPAAVPPPTEPVLIAHADQAEERQLLRDIAHAYDVVKFVDALTTPPESASGPVTSTTGREATVGRPSPPGRSAPVAGTGACGGDLPDCSIMACESGGNLTAENSRSSAAGKWQMLQSTSDNLARRMGRDDLIGVPASQWSEPDQDAAARILWDGGNGAGNWAQCL